jgi:hypothetical protein
MLLLKKPRYENRDLLDLCHDAPCFLRLEGCRSGIDPCVPCHPTSLALGRGLGYKTPDNFAVPGCPWCHLLFDEHMSKAEALLVWQRAYPEWDLYRWSHGLVQVG